MAKTYRDIVVETIVDMDVFLRKLDLDIVNMAMLGEYSEFDALFDEGDVVSFNIEDFENVEDQNVQKVMKLFYQISEVKESIRNINAISANEIEDCRERGDYDDDLPF